MTNLKKEFKKCGCKVLGMQLSCLEMSFVPGLPAESDHYKY